MTITVSPPSCSDCPWMRYEGTVMRCYHEPPLAQVLGTIPSRLAGGPPQLVIAGISPEVHEGRFCRHHPELADGKLPEVLDVVPAMTHVGSVEVQ